MAVIQPSALNNFNPRSHERSDHFCLETAPANTISIHAPTRGATFLCYCVSNISHQFQSTLPREERREEGISAPSRKGISIHAPTRGATQISHLYALLTLFQSTLPREERLDELLLMIDDKEFQSTLPREERRIDELVVTAKQHFNPRSHERSDKRGFACQTYSCNFNPRSHERSDQRTERRYITLTRFQSTLPREERQKPRHILTEIHYFNPRSHERSDAV